MSITIPDQLLAYANRAGWPDWLDRLPRMTEEVLGDWQLRLDGAPMAGSCALVVPVRDQAGTAAALKISWPHWEAETEHLALRYWDGDGAVRLLRADPRRFALLLERADGSQDLRSRPVTEALEIVAGLYPRLHRTPPPQLRRLSELAADWVGRLPRLIEHGGVPRRLVEHAIGLARDFSTDPATDGTLIHTDLHYENVLASLRPEDERPDDESPDGAGGWLVIDPKPLSGDPTYEVAPLLWNRFEELPADRIRDGLLDRLYTVVDAAGFDEDRTRDWVLVREVVNVLWAVEDGDSLTTDWLTNAITIAKAMQR